MSRELNEKDVLKIIRSKGPIAPQYVEEESDRFISKEEIRIALYSLCSKGVIKLNDELKLIIREPEFGSKYIDKLGRMFTVINSYKDDGYLVIVLQRLENHEWIKVYEEDFEKEYKSLR